MRYVFDLDGVICQLKTSNQTYEEVIPNKQVIKIINQLKENENYIIIHTARHMKTCKGDVVKVKEKIGKITEKWLKKWNVNYDELIFGKPHGDVYIDDLGITFSSADNLINELDNIKMNFVIPMAGEGKRFKNTGIKKPKFMIKYKEKILFDWAIESLPMDLVHKIYFICLKEHEKNFSVKKLIKSHMKKISKNIDFEIIFINKKTRGQAESVLAAKQNINNERSLLIFNIDSYFKSSRLKSNLKSLKNRGMDGLIGVCYSKNPMLSFVKKTDKGFITKIKEKEVISNLASTGLYVFTKGSDFVKNTEYMINKDIKIKNEFYISEIYNIMIKKKKKFIVDTSEEFIDLGTPENLKKL
jgi:capsule biosynthesis phosphatase